jgi:hypothetical protein
LGRAHQFVAIIWAGEPDKCEMRHITANNFFSGATRILKKTVRITRSGDDAVLRTL